MPFFRLICNKIFILNMKKAFRPLLPQWGAKIAKKHEKKNYYKIWAQPGFELGLPGWKVSVSPTRLQRIL